MSDAQAVISTVIALFIMLAVGYIARKTGILNEDSSKHLSKLIICVGQPFMIIGAMLGIESTPDNLKSGALVLILGTAAHIVISIIARVATLWIKDAERRIAEFAIVFANCGFMGFPLLQAVFGDVGIFRGSFYIIIFNIVTWTWGMSILLYGKGGKHLPLKTVVFKAIVNYGTLPCIIGFMLFAFNVPVPEPVTNAINYLGGICTPVSMIIAGGLLSTMKPKEIFTYAKLYYVSAFKLIIVPVIVGLLAFAVGLPKDTVVFLTIMSAMPTAANTVMFAELYGIAPGFAAATVGLTTLLSTATLPLVTWLAGLLYQ